MPVQVEEARGEARKSYRPVAGGVGVDNGLLADAQVGRDVREVLAVVDHRNGHGAPVRAQISGRLWQIGRCKKGGGLLGGFKADENCLGCRDQLGLPRGGALLQVAVQVQGVFEGSAVNHNG